MKMNSKSKLRSDSTRSTILTIGYVLWRGGLYFAAGYAAFAIIRWILRSVLEVGIPGPLLIALALLVAGAVIVLVSLVMERIADARNEHGLKDR